MRYISVKSYFVAWNLIGIESCNSTVIFIDYLIFSLSWPHINQRFIISVNHNTISYFFFFFCYTKLYHFFVHSNRNLNTIVKPVFWSSFIKSRCYCMLNEGKNCNWVYTCNFYHFRNKQLINKLFIFVKFVCNCKQI